jgi:periplasmic divalent cation tolerance protein
VIVSDVRILLTTITEDRAAELATRLVEERLAACVSVSGPMTSTYRWKGGLERERECQLIIKTTAAHVAELERRLPELHPYALPEFVVLRPEAVSRAYAAWVDESTGGAGAPSR